MFVNRIIKIEGDELLPPCYEPQFPPDMKEDERVRVIPPCPPWVPETSDDIIAVMRGVSPQDQRYWFFGEGHEHKLPQFDWLGDPRTALGVGLFGSGKGLDSVLEATVFRFKTKSAKVRFPELWQPFGDGSLIMSKCVLDIMLAFDAGALAYRSVIFTNNAAECLRDDFFIVDVVRNLPAIDIANSTVDYRGPSRGYPPSLTRFQRARVRDDLDPDLHIFRQVSFVGSGGREIIVSASLRQALEAVKPKLKNIRFDPCGGLA